jgi:iron complex outermembrane receptor protein
MGCAAAVAATAMALPAAAQPRTEAAIEEVVVTARRIEESAQDIPISISVASGEQLRRANVTDLRTLQNFTPGVLIRGGTSDPAGSTIVMRGIGAADTLLTTDTSVGVYVDGVYLPRTVGLRGLLQNPEEIARIETLRGPQGTLFGRNTTAGALNVTTVSPQPVFSAYGTGTAATDSIWEVTAGVNIPLAEDVALRIGGVHREEGGIGRASDGREVGTLDLNAFHVRMQLGTGQRFTADVSADYQRSETSNLFKLHELCGQPGVNCGPLVNTAAAGATPNPPYIGAAVLTYIAEVVRGLPAACRTNAAGTGGCPANAASVINAANAELLSYASGDPYLTYGTGFDVGASEAIRLGLTNTLELTDALTLKSITGYIKTDRAALQDLDGTPYPILVSNNEQRDETVTQEVQLIGSYDRFNFVLGGFANWEDGFEFGPQFSFAPLTNAPITIVAGDVNNKSHAVFGQANYELTSRFTLTGGLRYTKETRELVSRNHAGGPRADVLVNVASVTGNTANVAAPYTACSLPGTLLDVLPNPLAGGGAPGICQISLKNSYSDVSWLASADYKLTEDILVFAKASKGFRSGGQQLRGSSIPASFLPFAPESLLSYELGLKSTFFDNHARLNVSGWWSDYKDIQKSVIVLTPSGNATVTQNAAAATLYGVDLEATVVPIERLTLNGTLSYTHAQYDKYIDGNIDRTEEPFTGTTGIPKWTVSVGARYVVPLEMGDLAFQLNYRWQDDMVTYRQPLTPNSSPCCTVFADPRLAERMDSYDDLSGRISLDIDSWDATVSVFGTNLTNEEVLLPGQDLNTSGYRAVLPQRKRTIGVTIAKRFGG